ncbi:Major facilitator superfamily domain general substrate transporter protein [Rutstroemia sp. NJR-2017a BVV2]|nr:Major facilitator superfamily domain general substrate transporter protein [Rutstroemia sp. NJR-2017a BVV2]
MSGAGDSEIGARIGRKPVFALAILGLLLSLLSEIAIMHAWRVLPIRLVWLAPFVQFLGGGDKTASAIFYAIISDVTTQSQRANAFLFGACATLTAELIAPTVASSLMAISPWIPLCCGLAVLALGLCLIAFIPETLHLRASTNVTLDCEASTGGSSDDSDSITKLKPTLHRRLSDSITNIYVSTTPFHTLPILLLLLPFITRVVGSQSIDLCIRYISARFEVPLSHASLILSLRALINILLLLFFIPLLSTLLISKFHFTSQGKDLYLARTSSLFLIAGALLLATSPSLPLTLVGLVTYTLGTGFVSLVRSLITSLVDAEHVARLYAIIAVVETSSALLAGPMVAGLYEMGLEWKGAWLGLPFWGLAGVLTIGAGGTWCVRVGGGEERSDVMVRDREEEELPSDNAGYD